MRKNDFYYLVILIFSVFACTTKGKINNQTMEDSGKEPVKETYSRSDAPRSGVALGGIGAGSIELRKDGNFYNWSIFNNYPVSAGPVFDLPNWPRDGWEEDLLFFIVRYQVEGEDARMKILNINQSINEGGLESIAYYYPWMTAIENIEYSGRFPFVNMKFTDSEMPLEIEMEAFSPFIPHDLKNSTLPGVYFDFKVKSTTDKPVKVTLLGTLRNTVGYDTWKKYFKSGLTEGEGYKYFDLSVGGMNEKSPTFGQMGLVSLSEETTYYLGWEHKHPYYERLLEEPAFPNIDDTKGRNIIDKETGEKIGRMGFRTKDQRHFSSSAITKDLKSNESFDHSFAMAWYFPNDPGAHSGKEELKYVNDEYALGLQTTKIQGNYYNNFFNSASDVARYLVENKEDLEHRTRQFVNDFYASDVPQFVLDQINSNLNTFITSSTLTKDGTFALREGLTEDKSWGPNATIDVSLYGSVPVLYLFPELQKSMMIAHRNAQAPNGEINHGLAYDPDFTRNGTWGVFHRIDMPPNYIQLVLRDYFATNDRQYLEELWPSLQKAAEYVLNERDKDENMMPDMEGIMCSYDNFPMWGLASYIQSQWIGAMAAMVDAAEIIGDDEAKVKYKEILDKGSQLMDEKLWNGEYYRLSNDYNGAFGDKGIDEGCLTDQIIGQWIAHLSGLGYLFEEENVKNALGKIMEMNYREIGLRNCSWPEYPNRFPIAESDLWVDQANTPWTGVELAFASFLLYEGMFDEAMKVIKNIDDRYRANGLYWDHQEFGGHYYRPMSAWAIVNGLLGLGINQGHYAFSPKIPKDDFKMFFAAPSFTAHYEDKNNEVAINVLTGDFKVNKVSIKTQELGEGAKAYINDESFDAKVSYENNLLTVDFEQMKAIPAGSKLVIR